MPIRFLEIAAGKTLASRNAEWGFAEAVQLRRRYAVMKDAARARRR